MQRLCDLPSVLRFNQVSIAVGQILLNVANPGCDNGFARKEELAEFKRETSIGLPGVYPGHAKYVNLIV